MSRMRTLMVLLYLVCSSAQAECLKCEKIRKYHDEHPEQNYEYYEDYLKDLEEGKVRSSAYPGENDNDQKNMRSKRGE